MQIECYISGMRWEELCADKSLEDIPYRVELTRHGQLLMSPHKSYHSIYQSRIIRWLNKLMRDGEAMPECPIQIETGVLVADVAWASPEKVKRNFDLPAWNESPEIVIEVISPSNAEEEITKKRNALFAKGAVEFWRCERDGSFRFFARSGELQKSDLCPAFPISVATPG